VNETRQQLQTIEVESKQLKRNLEHTKNLLNGEKLKAKELA
jgi:hypothetical protein